MAVKQLPTLSPIPEPPNRLVGDQERFDTMTFNRHRKRWSTST